MYVKVLFVLEGCVFFVFFCDFWAKKEATHQCAMDGLSVLIFLRLTVLR